MATAEPHRFHLPPCKTNSELICNLRTIGADCAQPNWDGYGAMAVSEAVILRAKALIRALPESIPMPDLSAEPDGQVSFDWLPASTRTFTLSVNEDNHLAYAWIDGANRGHATEVFEEGTLPARLLSELRRITADAPAVQSEIELK